MAELRSGGQIDSGSESVPFQITNGHLGEQLPCLPLLRLQFCDLFFCDLFELSLELGAIRVGGKQLQAFLLGSQREVILSGGPYPASANAQVSIAQAVLGGLGLGDACN